MKFRIKQINQDDVINCHECLLHKSPKSLSWGNLKSKILFVGSNPADTIKKDRLCFASKSFLLFFEIIKELGYETNQFYYSNLVRCATPNNRPPNSKEIWNCHRFLTREISIIKPKRIIVLGRVIGNQFNLDKFYVGKYHEKLNTDMFMIPHPSYVTRFRKELKRYRTYLEYLLK